MNPTPDPSGAGNDTVIAYVERRRPEIRVDDVHERVITGLVMDACPHQELAINAIQPTFRHAR
jgi:ribose 1,5-bisphosphokinase PhnN